MSPLFSVVIPTYNRPQKLVRAVQSVLAQTCQDYEVWVINDGSTIDVATALEPFCGRVNYLSKPNGGISSTRNAGINQAQGRYIAFLDDDDWWYPTKLQAMAEAIESHPEVGLFYSKVEYVSSDGTILWTTERGPARSDAYLALLEFDFIPMSSVVVRKECFDRAGLFDTALNGTEDWDMWIRIAQQFSIYWVPQVLAAYEFSTTDRRTINYSAYLEERERAFTKALRNDPSLGPKTRNRIRASYEYVEGKIYLAAREDAMALRRFWKSLLLRPTNWRALVYIALLLAPWLRRGLPRRVGLALRLPESYLANEIAKRA